MDRAIYLVSCVKTKRHHPSPARELYCSDWFVSARAYVEARHAPWFILSAKYGLLDPDEIIEPYEVTLKGQAASQRRAWANTVAQQLHQKAPLSRHIVMLAGQTYGQYLTPALQASGIEVERPMSRLRQGEQLSWLKRNA